MNALLTMIRSICLLVLVSAFWELLVPAGKLRQPVRLVIGLLLVSVIIIPLTDYLSREPNDFTIDFPEVTDTADVLAEGEEIAGQLEQVARSEYEEQLARQVASLCLLTEGVRESRAAVSADSSTGVLKQIYVEAELDSGVEGSALQSKLIKLISTFYGIEPEVIECYVKEAAVDDGTGEEPNQE